jgi:hypothetical protein
MSWVRESLRLAMVGAGALAIVHAAGCGSSPPASKSPGTKPSPPIQSGSVGDHTSSRDGGADGGPTSASKTVKSLTRQYAEAHYEQARREYEALEQASLDAGADGAPTEAQRAAAEAKLSKAAAELDAKDVAIHGSEKTEDPNRQTEIEFETGSRLRYGVNATFLELTFSRPEDEPGRYRNYAPKLEMFPPQIGFQFISEPSGRPWRYTLRDGKHFQLMSWGGLVLAKVDAPSRGQGAVRLGATLNFFNNVIGLGVGFDLYRGIPVLGPGGEAGTGTAYTGVLAWAFTKEGEVTPENVFVVFTFGLQPIIDALSGTVKQ